MLTIAWDVDDILNDLMRVWLEEWWQPQHPDCRLRYAELTQNPPHRLVGVERAEYLKSLDAFRMSGRYEDLQPNFRVLEWFQAHGASFRHIALTAVPRVAAPVSAGWVIRHFGDWIRMFHFVPSSRNGVTLPQYDQNKAAWLRRLPGVDILIDDCESNCAGLPEDRMRSLLVSRPWNTGTLRMEGALRNLTQLAF